MCGIIGYTGPKEAEPILIEGLRRVEYRGYDSAGLATLTGPHLHLRKRAGRIADPGWRSSLLRRVPENARTLDLARTWEGISATQRPPPS